MEAAIPKRAVLDILVVGAGPAGVAAGLEARRLGLDSLVVDKATFPRDKTCGDGLTTGALRVLDEIGFDVRALPSWAAVTDTVLVSPTGREVEVPLPPDGAYAGVVPRVELDAALVEHARAHGVEVLEGAGVTVIDAGDDTVTATLADGTEVTARFVVAADGHWSPVRRMIGAESATPLGSWHAFRQYFTGVDDRRLWVLFEEDLLPGYAWVFPVGAPGERRANVGFGVLRASTSKGADGPSGKALAAQWRSLVERPSIRRALGPDAKPEGTVRAWPIPAAYDRDRLTHGRVLFAGDAGNVVDPMTGEGIAQAIETGLLAARAIAASPSHASSPFDATSVAARYRADVDRELGADLRFASLLQHVLRVPLGARAAIRTASLTPWTRRNFARWMWEDYPRALLLTPKRWHRRMFEPSPAYSNVHVPDGTAVNIDVPDGTGSLHSTDGPH
ncbi:MAG TPA: geranylgeranyl reductase family protein [Acidimicrobiia bacterium]